MQAARTGIIFALLSFCLAVNATDLTISKPGIYILGNNITSTPGGATNIINITSSDVVLDLGGYVVVQGNNTASVDGIVINANLTDIVIRNGTIRNVTGNGLIIGAGNARIRVSNIVFENCATTGFKADGTVTTITDIEMQLCRFYNCCSNASGQNIVTFTLVNRLLLNDCVIAGTNNSASILNCIKFSSCSMCSVSNVIIQNNSNSAAGSTFAGISDSSMSDSQFSNITVRNNSSTPGASGFLYAFNTQTSLANVYNNCLVASNTTSGAFLGFNITGTSDIFSQCSIIQCSGSNVNPATQGFVDGTATGCIYIDCIVSGLSAGGFNVNGFNLGSTNDIVARAISTRNSGGLSIGFLASNSNTFMTIYDSLFSANTGISAAFGADDNNGVNVTHNLWYRNVAFNNTTGQFAGGSFSQTTPAAPATQNIAGVTASWTNLAVAA
jgi:hypothetical protein